jgi:hypothetical protein
MPAAKPKPPQPAASSSDLNAAIARVRPDLVRLLADGMRRSKAAITKALAERHDQQDIRRTLLRLAVTGELVEHKGRFTLPHGDQPEEGG